MAGKRRIQPAADDPTVLLLNVEHLVRVEVDGAVTVAPWRNVQPPGSFSR